jgi:hypothetical protein
MRRRSPRWGLAISAAALAAGLLAGCASEGGGGAGSAGPAPSTSLAPPVTPTTAKPPAAAGATVTVVGRVQAGVEVGCLLINDEAGGGSWLLLGGDPKVVKAGARVRVTGTEARGVATICQQGRPLQVRYAAPA